MGTVTAEPSMTFYLCARPSFLGGAAQLMDLGNTLFVYNESLTPSQADYLAMKADWATIGNDLRYALQRAIPEGPRLKR